MEPRKFKYFIEQAARLPQRQRADLADLLHRSSLKETTAALIEAAAAPHRACPRCRSVRLHRHGHADGLQRYRCVDCARTFNALTGTPLARLRHRTKWLPYLDCMLESGTVRRAAALVGIHKNTSFRWRHRFLTRARTDRSWPLGGITEADETYLLESQKGARQLDRPARRRGGSARRRGLSHEQVCILVARDRTGKTVDFVTGRAPLTAAQLRRHLAPVVAHDTLLVTDGHPAYRAFARAAGITHRAVNLSARVRVAAALHVQNVNAYHSPQPVQGVAEAFPRGCQPLPAELPRLALGRRRRQDWLAGDAAQIGAGRFPPLYGDIAFFMRAAGRTWLDLKVPRSSDRQKHECECTLAPEPVVR